MSKHTSATEQLMDTIVRMALWDGNEVEPNVFRTPTLAEIGHALGVSREYVRQVLEERGKNINRLKKRARFRDARYRKHARAATFPRSINGRTTPEYDVYRNMLARCLNKNHPDYKRYGGRGVVVCDRWLGKMGFQTFMLDFGRLNPNVKGTRATFSIHRIDNVLLYSPKTVKWATGKEQCAAGQRQYKRAER